MDQYKDRLYGKSACLITAIQVLFKWPVFIDFQVANKGLQHYTIVVIVTLLQGLIAWWQFNDRWLSALR